MYRSYWGWRTIQLALAILLLAALWALCYWGTHELSQIEFYTNSEGTNSTGDAQVFLLPAAAVVFVGYFLLTWEAYYEVAVGIAVITAAIAAAYGWYDSVADHGVPFDDVVAWIAVSVALAAVVAVMLPFGLWGLLRHYGFPTRWRRSRAVARARAHGWEPTSPRHGTALLAFHDRDGVRHDVGIDIHVEYRHEPLLAIYDPAHPQAADTLVAAAPFTPSLARRTLWRQLKQELPAPGDEELWADLHQSDPGVGLESRLERVVDRRRRGELTAEQFRIAKWAALTAYVRARPPAGTQ